MFPRPLTRIHQIEPSSRCNLRCRYCPHPKMQRPKDDMEMSVFERTMEWVEYFVAQPDSNQTELSLTGLGEPLLHPNFVDMVKLVRQVFNGKLLFSTNGLLLTKELCEAIAPYNVDVYVSAHRPEKATPGAINARNAGMSVIFNMGFVNQALDWAGQVDWEVTAPATPCKYLGEGWGTVLQDGAMTTCCMDAEGDGIVGHVNDELGSLAVKPYKLCEPCSLIVPSIMEVA